MFMPEISNQMVFVNGKHPGSVALCRHNLEHNIWSIRHNAGIILTFLQHYAVVSENCEKCVQILPAIQARMYKVDKSC